MRVRRISGADPQPIAAPPDWNEETHGHCTALFVRRETINGIEFMRSAWEGEGGEALLILAGAAVVLGVAADRHPVVNMGVAELPDYFDPVMQSQCFVTPGGARAVRVEMLFCHDGGRKAFASVLIDGTLADAVSTGITRIEAYARKEGWIT